MKKITLVLGLVLALVVPSTAGAKPVPDNGDKRAAKQECKVLRGHGKATREAFRTRYRSFRACVKDKAAEEAQEEQTAHRNASRDCRAERQTLGKEAFAEQYGTNANRKNAFGKCVSQKARAMEKEADEQDQEEATAFKNAAKECAAERETLGEDAFREQYGTNANKRNAFGKCVSQHAREDDDPDASPEG
jgi:hypothetical protein